MSMMASRWINKLGNILVRQSRYLRAKWYQIPKPTTASATTLETRDLIRTTSFAITVLEMLAIKTSIAPIIFHLNTRKRLGTAAKSGIQITANVITLEIRLVAKIHSYVPMAKIVTVLPLSIASPLVFLRLVNSLVDVKKELPESTANVKILEF